MESIRYLWFTCKDEKLRQEELRKRFWEQVREDNIDRVKKEIEKALEVEFKEAMGAGWYERKQERQGYRGGYRYRDLHIWGGYISRIRVPKGKKGFKFRLIKPWSRRTEDISEAIYRAYVYGMSDRRVKEYFGKIYGENIISAAGVSYLYKRLTKDVDKWHRRKLKDEYRYLYLDGMVQGVKEAVRKQKTVLVAYGVRCDGSKEVIDYAIENGESTGSWARFIGSLRERGLKGNNLELIMHDGCPGLIEALDWIWPSVKTQMCCVHHMRNLGRHIKSFNAKRKIVKDASKIYKSPDKKEAYRRISEFQKRWQVVEPKAVKLFIKNIDKTLTFYDFPKELWKSLKSTNPIERYLEEWRRRLRTMRCLNNIYSCDRILYGQVLDYNAKQKDIPCFQKSELCLT